MYIMCTCVMYISKSDMACTFHFQHNFHSIYTFKHYYLDLPHIPYNTKQYNFICIYYIYKR